MTQFIGGKPMKRYMKRLVCVAAVVAILVTIGSFLAVNAASNSITVTSAISGERLYSGNDLQEAFDAAERGSIVTLGRTYTLTADVELSVEVMINGQNFLKFGSYHIQLSGDGAIYVTDRFSRSSYITAKNAYSEVDWVEESGGYIYYLITQAPNMDAQEPTINIGSNLSAAKLDAENGIIYLDINVSGMTTSALASGMTMKAENAEAVGFMFSGDAMGYAANGMIMSAVATNYDYGQAVKKNYTVIVLGDVNGNGKIDSADASLISAYASGKGELSEVQLLAADANCDGTVTAADAMFICKKYVRQDSYTSPLR